MNNEKLINGMALNSLQIFLSQAYNIHVFIYIHLTSVLKSVKAPREVVR